MTSPSPDVAKLIERLREHHVAYITGTGKDPAQYSSIYSEAADALAAQQGRVERAERALLRAHDETKYGHLITVNDYFLAVGDALAHMPHLATEPAAQTSPSVAPADSEFGSAARSAAAAPTDGETK